MGSDNIRRALSLGITVNFDRHLRNRESPTEGIRVTLVCRRFAGLIIPMLVHTVKAGNEMTPPIRAVYKLGNRLSGT